MNKKTVCAVVLPLLVVLFLMFGLSRAMAEQIGEVDTVFKLLSPNHKIVVDAYDDPNVGGVTCYVSRAKTGGYKGALGLAEDKSEASIACRQTGAITFFKPLEQQEEVMSERIITCVQENSCRQNGRCCAQYAGLPDLRGPRD